MNSSKFFRFSLSVLLLASVFWFWGTRFDELVYHTFPSSELVDIGDAQIFSKIRETIKPNSFVKVSGVLGNKAATLSGLRAGSMRFGRFQVRHLLGSKLYIEYNESRYHSAFSPFKRVTVSGRLVSFGPNSELHKVRKFFKEHYYQPISDDAMLIVVDETPRSEWVYLILFSLSILILFVSFFYSLRNLWRKVEI